jgi:hypothetical protein
MSEREFEHNARLFANGQISRRRFIKRMVAGGASVAAAIAFADVTAAGAWGRSTKHDWGHTYGHPRHYGKPCDDHVYGHHEHKPPKHDWPPPGRDPEHHWPPPDRDSITKSFWARWGKRKR